MHVGLVVNHPVHEIATDEPGATGHDDVSWIESDHRLITQLVQVRYISLERISPRPHLVSNRFTQMRIVKG